MFELLMEDAKIIYVGVYTAYDDYIRKSNIPKSLTYQENPTEGISIPGILKEVTEWKEKCFPKKRATVIAYFITAAKLEGYPITEEYLKKNIF